MELWSSASKEWNSSPLFINTWILTLSFQTLEFLYCPSKHFNFGPIFYTWKFWCHRSKHWNSGPIFINIGILALSFDFKHWNSGRLFMHIGILILFFQTLEFWPFFFINNGILALFLQTLQLLSYSSTANIEILALYTLVFWWYASKH